MMNCNVARSLMSEALDGVLSEDAVESVNTHMRECSACHTHWQAMQHVSSLFRTAAHVAPPADFTARVMRHMTVRQAREAEQPTVRRPFGTLAWASGAAAVALALAVIAVAAGGLVRSSDGMLPVSALSLSMAVSDAAITTGALIDSTLAIPLRILGALPAPALALLALWMVAGTAALGLTVGSLVAAYQPVAASDAAGAKSS